MLGSVLVMSLVFVVPHGASISLFTLEETFVYLASSIHLKLAKCDLYFVDSHLIDTIVYEFKFKCHFIRRMFKEHIGSHI